MPFKNSQQNEREYFLAYKTNLIILIQFVKKCCLLCYAIHLFDSWIGERKVVGLPTIIINRASYVEVTNISLTLLNDPS